MTAVTLSIPNLEKQNENAKEFNLTNNLTLVNNVAKKLNFIKQLGLSRKLEFI